MILPVNFDGSKFQTKYPGHPFWVESGELFCPSLPDLVEADLLDCVLTPADLAETASQEQARLQVRQEYLSTITTLVDIETRENPTNAQVLAAVRFLAKTLRLLLKILIARFL